MKNWSVTAARGCCPRGVDAVRDADAHRVKNIATNITDRGTTMTTATTPNASTAITLTAAAYESPWVELPRLALADYYEESGDAERAELIRLQVEASRFEGTNPAPVARARIDALLAAGREGWLAGLPR